MHRLHAGSPIRVATLALLASLAALPAAARGGYHHAQSSAPLCGVAAGGLPDPAQTQRCLGARFKTPRPKPAAAPAPSNAATPSTNPAG